MKRVLAAVDGVTKFNLWLVPSEVMACCTPRTHRSSLLPHLIGLTPSLTCGHLSAFRALVESEADDLDESRRGDRARFLSLLGVRDNGPSNAPNTLSLRQLR